MEAIDKLLAAENKVVSSIQKQFRRAHIFVHELLQKGIPLPDEIHHVNGDIQLIWGTHVHAMIYIPERGWSDLRYRTQPFGEYTFVSLRNLTPEDLKGIPFKKYLSRQFE